MHEEIEEKFRLLPYQWAVEAVLHGYAGVRVLVGARVLRRVHRPQSAGRRRRRAQPRVGQGGESRGVAVRQDLVNSETAL